jgi:hypothetical protein
MISFNFSILNPWSRHWKTLWCKHSLLSIYKVVEFNGYKTNSIITVDFNLTSQTDHAGLRLMLGLFGYEVEIHFYDTRHWDNEKDSWTVYN